MPLTDEERKAIVVYRQEKADGVESILADLSDVFEQRPLPEDVTYTEIFF